MTASENTVTASAPGRSVGPDRPDGRAERVLDVAAGLLGRWGYQRVTIDDVARHAGIGKGTVYLHFRTKDALFVTVLLRANRRRVSALADRMLADPAELLPARMVRSGYLELVADPVSRSLYLADGEILGRLAHEAADTLGELAAQRDRVVRSHLELLREAGCLRRDLGVEAQQHVIGAITTGFFFVDGQPSAPPDPQVRADLLEHAIAAALQVPEPPTAELARLAPVVAQQYRGLITHIDDEWHRRVR